MAKRKDFENENDPGREPALDRADAVLARLGASVERLRKQQGLTAESLSEQTRANAALGQSSAVSKKAIIAIEAGQVNPRLTTVHAIAKALGVTIDVLVY